MESSVAFCEIKNLARITASKTIATSTSDGVFSHTSMIVCSKINI
jgi:hypothetical protein